MLCIANAIGTSQMWAPMESLPTSIWARGLPTYPRCLRLWHVSKKRLTIFVKVGISFQVVRLHVVEFFMLIRLTEIRDTRLVSTHYTVGSENRLQNERENYTSAQCYQIKYRPRVVEGLCLKDSNELVSFSGKTTLCTFKPTSLGLWVKRADVKAVNRNTGFTCSRFTVFPLNSQGWSFTQK